MVLDRWLKGIFMWNMQCATKIGRVTHIYVAGGQPSVTINQYTYLLYF